MKVSEAMILGSTTTKPTAYHLDGCAIGMAGNAAGLASCREAWAAGTVRRELLYAQWPWLRDDAEWGFIAKTFNDDVMGRRVLSLDQLARCVREIEPDCNCNRFNCDCAKTALPEPAQEVVHA